MTNPKRDPSISQQADPSLSERAISDPAWLGSEAVAPLYRALSDTDFHVRWNAVDALARIGDVRAFDALCQALGDTESGVRQRAVEALVTIGVDAVAPLCKALEANDEAICQNAARTLGEIGDVRAVIPLCQQLRDKNRNMRWSAAMALERIGDSNTLPRKILAETRLTPQQRFNGLEALQYTRSRDPDKLLPYSLRNTREYCRTLLLDDEAAVRAGAQSVLAFLDGNTLLIPSQRDETTEKEELLRGATPIASATSAEEMLRASGEAQTPPDPPKRRGLLAKLRGAKAKENGPSGN